MSPSTPPGPRHDRPRRRPRSARRCGARPHDGLRVGLYRIDVKRDDWKLNDRKLVGRRDDRARGHCLRRRLLKGAFTEIEKAHPELKITTNYDGSNSLLDQLSGGARADVFASADTTTMDRARAADVVTGEPKTFATNVLVLVVPKGNPAKITGMNDTLTGTKLVICAAKVPCGNATRALASQLGLTLRPVSEETKVTDVRGKVESGEADAGIVYATDAKVSGDKVEVIAVPKAKDIVNKYPIAVVKGAARPDAGQAFIDAVLSAQGRAVLAKYGFGTP